MKVNKSEKIGMRNVNYQGMGMEIIDYRWSKDIDVKFDDGVIVKSARYDKFLDGGIRNSYIPTLYGVGYLGDCKFKVGSRGSKEPSYESWHAMITRCYSKKTQERQKTYKDCEVCEEWHNYSNFKKWYDENYYNIDGCKMCLDKDIFSKGNKIYSPENCVFVPSRINLLFVKNNKNRGDLPIGVKRSKNGRYVSACLNNESKVQYLGTFDDVETAFDTYKQFKELTIKQVADEYKNKIPQRLYDALYNYKVEITD